MERHCTSIDAALGLFFYWAAHSKALGTFAVFSATQVQMYPLWCQVRPQDNASMGSNIGDWYYPTTGDTFTLVPTSDPGNNVPYQSLNCTGQIGLVVDGNVTNNQGIVRCTTTVPNLDREANYFGVYSDNVYNSYSEC